MGYIRRKIILVDDLNLHLLSTKDRLKKFYEVFPAQSAEMLFEILEKVVPDLIFLDINMPEVNGYEVIKRLKEDERFAAIPVVFLTSNADRQSVIKGMNLGAVDFVTKPCTDTDLIECIETQLDPARRDANKPVVLAVDDNPSILKSVNYALNDLYRVYTLPQPTKLTDLLRVITPDLFLLDCQMPHIHGFDLVPIIRNISEHEETPIIFLTSDGTIDNISVALSLGARDFIVKPIDMFILREKVALHLADYVMWQRIRSLK